MKGTRHPEQVSPRASQLGWSVRWCRSEPLVEARSRRLLYCPHKMPDLAHEVVPSSPALPVQRACQLIWMGQNRIRTPWRMGHPLRGSWPGGDGTAGCESSQRERGTTDHLRARQIVRRGQTSAPDPLSATWRLMKRKKGSGLWTAGVSAFQKLIV